MTSFSNDLDIILEKMESEYCTYPLLCLYQYVKGYL
jgi:hypothetical protein